MHPSVERVRPQIEALCRRLGVRRLDLFGSATGDEFDESRSDVDVLVDLSGQDDPFHVYFALKEGLEALLGRPVDVVADEAIENPYVRRRVDEQREPLYAA